MVKKIIALSLFMSVALPVSSYADMAKIEADITKLENHLTKIAERFGGKLGAEEAAVEKKIKDLKQKLEGEKAALTSQGSNGNDDSEIKKLEEKLKKIQEKFGIGKLADEENNLKQKIEIKKKLY